MDIRRAKPECLNFTFGEEPEDRFVESVFAAQNQLEREQNRRQVMQKMKARIEAGYWPFCPPPGLSNQKDLIKGRILKPVQPFASIYKAAIEKFRDYELNTIEAVKDFVLAEYAKHGIKKPLSLNGTKRILSELLYCPYVEYEPWEVFLREGQHEGFITYETYLAVQDRLANRAKPRLRKDYNADFPVRNYALCSDCKKPLTACWNKGNGGKYGYYKCKTDGCSSKSKGIKKEVLEKSFEQLLVKVEPRSEILDFVGAILKDEWQQREKQELKIKNKLTNSIKDLEVTNSQLAQRAAHTTSQNMIDQYENLVNKNTEEIKQLQEKLAKIKYTQSDFQTAWGVVRDYVGEPIKQWRNKDYRRKRLLLQMYFEQKLVYQNDCGFQTTELPLVLELSQQKTNSKINLVDKTENLSNRLFDYLARFWRFYNSCQTLQNMLAKTA